MLEDSVELYWSYYNSLLLSNMFQSIPISKQNTNPPEPPDPPIPPVEMYWLGGILTESSDSSWGTPVLGIMN